jgi:hypothetical protein
MADRGNSKNKYRGHNLIHQFESDAARSLTPSNSSDSSSRKNQILLRIQDGFYDQDAILANIADQIELIYFR